MIQSAAWAIMTKHNRITCPIKTFAIRLYGDISLPFSLTGACTDVRYTVAAFVAKQNQYFFSIIENLEQSSNEGSIYMYISTYLCPSHILVPNHIHLLSNCNSVYILARSIQVDMALNSSLQNILFCILIDKFKFKRLYIKTI